MRIVYVTSSLPYGSKEAFIIPEIQEVIKRGHEVLIVPMYPKGPVVHTNAKPLLEHVSAQPLLSLHVMKWAAEEFTRAPTRAFRALSWLFRSCSSKVLLKNLAVYAKGLWLARLARAWEAEHIHVHWAATTATMALIASEASGIPWSLTAHSWDIDDWRFSTRPRSVTGNKLLALKVARSSFVRFISRVGLKRATTLAPRTLPNAQAFVLHMGVPLSALQERPHAARRVGLARPPVLLCPASFVPVKGHKYLVEAVAILRELGIDLELWLAGKGELREELEKQARRLDLLDRISFLGELSHPDLLELYRREKVDIVVLPSVDLGGGGHEGIPASLIEAMSYRVPVVSTTTGGIPELLEEGAGSLVPPADPAALARAIGNLIEDPELRVRQGEAGRRRVEENFALEKVVDELIARFEACAR